MRLFAYLTAMLVALAGLPGATAAASSCPPPGGETIPAAATAAGDFSFTGRGWGHGAGMSQYGARGAARLGCTAAEILGTYYPGTQVGAAPTPSSTRVGFYQSATVINVEAVGGAVPWELCDAGSCEALPEDQPQGSRWTVTTSDEGAYVVSDGEREVFRGGGPTAALRALFNGTVIRLPATGNRYRWGTLEFTTATSEAGTTMFVVIDVGSVERYLYGLAEMPSSWEVAALQAQAIAGRSYAVERIQRLGIRSECRCHLYATVRDQAYSGYEKEAEPGYGHRWVAAVDATAGQVVTYAGAVVSAFYSSSHGGFSESSAFVFGGTEVPYLQPVDDTRWDLASDNPRRTWSVGVSAEALGSAAGVGTAIAVELPEPKGFGGRIGDPENPHRAYGGAVIHGTAGTVTLSGARVRQLLGLNSTLFEVRSPELASVVRASGPNRIETAVEVSRRFWDDSALALLATGYDFPDALAAGALAADLDAPLLLTNPDLLPRVVEDELGRLGVGRVLVLGGPAAVSGAVTDRLEALGMAVDRVAGPDRFATAARVAAEVGAASGEAILVLGGDWPDAVAAGALAAGAGPVPVLLTNRDEVPAVTEDALADLGVSDVVLIGGTGAVSAAVEDHLTGLGYDVDRLAGGDRYATSAAVATEALARLSGGGHEIVLASGAGFADALAAGALAGRLAGPLLLVPPEDLNAAPSAREFLRSHSGSLERGVVVGGTAAVAEQVLRQVAQLL